ncbi:MAG: phosphoenolpyruvate---glycerone phosphotransferase subunit DhaL, partial [Thermoanaerobacteraceae bacterium]|nr:phosphoenolpyruvate---glycerone phosphotransferase subunit DhaL [Thermoanaerobacteraceae bacterium]
MATDTAGLVKIIEAVAGKISENREFLTELDSAIGDADHGINMSKGFSAVLEKL